MTDRATRRAAFLDMLRADARRRFGPERAEALAPTLEAAADHLADVAVFPLEREELPAFYTGPAER